MPLLAFTAQLAGAFTAWLPLSKIQGGAIHSRLEWAIAQPLFARLKTFLPGGMQDPSALATALETTALLLVAFLAGAFVSLLFIAFIERLFKPKAPEARARSPYFLGYGFAALLCALPLVILALWVPGSPKTLLGFAIALAVILDLGLSRAGLWDLLYRLAGWFLGRDWFRFMIVGSTAFLIHWSLGTLTNLLILSGLNGVVLPDHDVFGFFKSVLVSGKPDGLADGVAVANRLGYVAGWTMATIYAFLLNKIWTFGDREGSFGRQGLLFFLGRGLSFAITFCTNVAFVEYMGIPFVFSQVFNGLLNFVINFLFAKFIVFRGEKTAA
jgi:putative flippase GtrA